jgi:hypothetical protein
MSWINWLISKTHVNGRQATKVAIISKRFLKLPYLLNILIF